MTIVLALPTHLLAAMPEELFDTGFDSGIGCGLERAGWSGPGQRAGGWA